MITTRNNFNVISTRYSNGAKIDNFVFILINVRFCVLPMREILLAILAGYLVVHFSLSTKLLIWGKGVVSKETVVLRRWESCIQKFGFINGVDNVN